VRLITSISKFSCFKNFMFVLD